MITDEQIADFRHKVATRKTMTGATEAILLLLDEIDRLRTANKELADERCTCEQLAANT